MRDNFANSELIRDRLLLDTNKNEVLIGIKGDNSDLDLQQIPKKFDIAMRLNAKVLAGLASEKIAGKALSGAELSAVFAEILSLPGETPSEQQGEKLVFADQSPFRATISAEGVVLAMSIIAIEAERTYKLPVVIEVRYVRHEAGLERLQAITISPTDPESRLSRRQKIAVEELQETLEQEFAKQLIPKEIELGGGNAVLLKRNHLSLAEGYLDATWVHTSSSP